MEIIEIRQINSKTFDLGGGVRRVSVSQGTIHYKDALGSWQDIDDQFNEPDDTTFTAKFTKCYYFVRIGENGSRRIYPDRNDLSYWIQLDKPNGINMSNPAKTGNTWTWDYPHAQIIIQMQSSQVKFSFILKDAQAPTSITIPFSVQGITRTGNILYHNGTPCGELRKPIAIDANFIHRDCTATFGAGQVTISLDTTGLSFPIDIDPTVNLQVSADSDDMTVQWESGAWHTYFPTDNVIFLGGVTGDDRQGSGMRFLNANLPAGATITTASMTFRCRQNSGGTTVKTYITGGIETSPATFTTLADYQARRGTVVGGADNSKITTTQVAWEGDANWVNGNDYTSPEIKTVIQEQLNTIGAITNIVLFCDDHDNRSSANSYWLAYNHVGSSTYAPKLDITYSNPVNIVKVSGTAWENIAKVGTSTMDVVAKILGVAK